MSYRKYADHATSSQLIENPDEKQAADRKHHLNAVARNRLYRNNEILKRGGGCEFCGCVEPFELYDWHHIDDTDDNKIKVSHLVLSHASLERLQREMDKCVVLCPTCHKKYHKDLLCMLDHKYRPDLIPYTHVMSEEYQRIEENSKPNPLQLILEC